MINTPPYLHHERLQLQPLQVNEEPWCVGVRGAVGEDGRGPLRGDGQASVAPHAKPCAPQSRL
jgi:hypothetical protein